MAQGGGQSPLLAQYNQWVAGRQIGPALPRSAQDFLNGAFGPLQPLVPMPIDDPMESGRPEPRRWQYPVGWNIPIGQPGTEGLKMASFPALRRYADLYSVVRAMLNIRKDEIAGTDWDIGAIPEVAANIKGQRDAGNDIKDRARKMKRWFKRPDPEYYSFASWLSSLLEERFVIDALSLYLHPTRAQGAGPFGSNLAALELLNGETIRPLVDIRGSTPRPPDPAYQQYLWGVPRSDMMSVLTDHDLDEMEDRLRDQGLDLDVDPEHEYRADQLWYLPRHKRTWTPYGFSEIEMAIVPITLGLNRQSFLLDWFTEGTIPGVYVIAGDSYATPTQQRVLQDSLNAIAGDIAWKHRVIVLPPGSKTEAQKDLTWAKDIDQNIFEQVMMILHIQPHEVGMVPGGKTSGLGGKGMAEEQAAAIQKTRTIPELLWLKSNLFDPIVQGIFGQKDLEWKWLGFEEEEDESQKTDSETKYISIGKMTIDEARIEDGLDPFNLPLTSTPVIIAGGTVTPLDPTVKAPPPPPAPVPALGDGSPNANNPAGSALAAAGLPTKVGSDKPKHNPLANLAAPKKGKRKKARNELIDRFTAHLKDQSDQIGEAQKEREKALDDKAKGKGGGKSDFKISNVGKVTVATLMKWRVKYNDDKLDGDDGIVATYLRRSYPEDVVKWAGDAKWTFEPHVKLDDIDFGRRPGGRDPKKVKSIADSLGQGASMDPIVLIDPEDGGKLRVADGYHRTLGAEKAGVDEVPAFIGTGVADDLDTIEGPMQDASDSKKKVAHAELAVLRRYLRKGGKVENFRTGAIDREVMKFLAADLAGGVALDPAIERAHGWVEKGGGNPQALRDWYNAGADGQIDWGSDGDFMACVNVASDHMDEEDAKGFCNERHQDATGGAPGTEKNFSLGAPLSTGLVPYDLAGQAPATCERCGRTLVNGRCPDHGPDGGGGTPAPRPVGPSSGPSGLTKYDDSEPRDDHGEWTSGGGGAAVADSPASVIDALRAGSGASIPGSAVRDLMLAGEAMPREPAVRLEGLSIDGSKPFGSGLGIARATMPQVPEASRPQLFAQLRSEGVSVEHAPVSVRDLRPSQDEISLSRTAGIWRDMQRGENPAHEQLLVSKDGYIIDGHHRWAAGVAESYTSGQPVSEDAWRIGMDARPLITYLERWDDENGINHRQLAAAPTLTKLLNAIDAELARRGVVIGKSEDGAFFTDEHGVHPIRDAAEYSPTLGGEGRGAGKPVAERYRIHQGRPQGAAKPEFGHLAGGRAGREMNPQFGAAHGATTAAFAQQFAASQDPATARVGGLPSTAPAPAPLVIPDGQQSAGLNGTPLGPQVGLNGLPITAPATTAAMSGPRDESSVTAALTTGNVTDLNETGGGVNTVYKADLGGVEAMLKPESELADEVMRFGIEPQSDVGRELAAQAVNDALGHLVDMPVSVARDDIPEFAGDRVLVQEWRDSQGTVGDTVAGWKGISDEDIHSAALFDAVIGNTDRHGGNALVGTDGGLIAIDHGLSFPNPAGNPGDDDYLDGEGNFRAQQTAASRDLLDLSTSDTAALQSLLEQKGELSSTLQSDGVTGGSLTAMWDRINYMLKTGQIITNPYTYSPA